VILCNEHTTVVQTILDEDVEAFLLCPGKTASIWCNAGHYVTVRSRLADWMRSPITPTKLRYMAENRRLSA
jgi:hypothetical protein